MAGPRPPVRVDHTARVADPPELRAAIYVGDKLVAVTGGQ